MGRLIHVDEELRLGSGELGDGSLGGDGELAGAHAVLIRDASGAWVVRDLGSSDGTFLNGRPLASAETIHRGDTLRLGSSRLLVVEGEARAALATEPLPDLAGQPILPTTPILSADPPAWYQGEAVSSAPTEEPARPTALRIAPLGRRWLAAVVDGLLLGLLVGVGRSVFGDALVVTLAAFALFLIYDFVFESLRGQTVGKRAMKLRVVRRDGSMLRPQQCAARNVLRFVDGLPGVPLVAAASMAATGKGRRQRLGDLAAGTVVVESEPRKAKLPEDRHDRLVLLAYPIVWLAPIVALALLVPSAAANSCFRAGITSGAAKEGTCVAANPNGGKELVTYANVGHTLSWSGYDIRLAATKVRRLKRPANLSVVALQLAVTNTTDAAVAFDAQSAIVQLTSPYLGELRSVTPVGDHIALSGLRPFSARPISAGATHTAWVRFAVPSPALSDYGAAHTDLGFRQLTHGQDQHAGVLRLWKAATPEGAAAALPKAG